MKAKAFLFSLLIIHFSSDAQVLIKSSGTEKGTSWKHADQMPEEALFFHTEGQLMQVGMAPNTEIVYAIVREEKRGKPGKKGSLVAYGLKTEQELWKVDFDQRMASLTFHGSMPILICEDRSEAFSPASGATVWRQPMQVRKIVPNAGIAIAAHHDPGIGRVTGFDLETGQTKWKYESSFLKSFNNLSVSGDTVVTFVWPDFHQIDLRTGEGFYVGLKNYNQGNVGGAVAFGIMFGLVGAMIYYGVTSPIVKMTIGSELERTLVYKGITYDASTTSVTAIHPQKSVLWAFGNSRGFVGIPKILAQNDVIYALFPGVLSTTDGTIQGHAVLVKIDPLNGKELDITWLSDSKTQFVTDFAVNGDTMLIAMNNKMVSINLESLETIASNQFGDVNFGSGLDRIVSPPYYILSGNEIIKESEAQLEKLYIQNTSGMKIEISKDFEPVGVVPKSRFFQFAGTMGGFTAYSNGARAVVANSENMLLPFEFAANFQMNGHYIWDWSAKELVLVPINGPFR